MANQTLDTYKDAIKRTLDSPSGGFDDAMLAYVSDMKNWLCVHATNYMPRRDKDGQLSVQTTGMATEYKYPRATVHFTINQIVSSNMGGNWDATPIVVLAPYNDIVKKNTNPQMVASEDTFFIPNPDTGLILPENTHIIRPNNDTLFQIGDKISTYKTDNFTDEETEMILSFVDPYEREIYGKVVLTKFLREIVVRMAMEKMGYRYVRSHEDEISGVIADVARASGINASSGDKGHSGSMEKEFEEICCLIHDFIDVLKRKDIKEIYDYMCMDLWFVRKLRPLKELDIYQLYEEVLHSTVDDIRYRVNFNKDRAKEYPKDPYYQKELAKAQEQLKYADELEKGGIAKYNANLDTVLRRNATRLNQEYANAMEKLKGDAEYPLLKQMLTDLVENGRKWKKTPAGWQPEQNNMFARFGACERQK